MIGCQILGTHWDVDEFYFLMCNSLVEPLYNFVRYFFKTMEQLSHYVELAIKTYNYVKL
jgi:hypothetical protein